MRERAAGLRWTDLSRALAPGLIAAAAACASSADGLGQEANALVSALPRASDTSGTASTSSTPKTSSGTGSGAGDANGAADGLGSLPNLGNISLPNFPLPAGLADLLKQLRDPDLQAAIRSALESQVCQGELSQLESLVEQALTQSLGRDPRAILAGQGLSAAGTTAAAAGQAVDFQPLADAGTAFLRCIASAVPAASGQSASAQAAAGGASRLSVASSATALAPASVFQLVEQLNAPPVMAALQRAHQQSICTAELRAFTGVAEPVLAGSHTLVGGTELRPESQMRPVAAALEALTSCVEGH